MAKKYLTPAEKSQKKLLMAKKNLSPAEKAQKKVLMARKYLTPAEKAQRKSLKNRTPNKRATFTERVEERIKNQRQAAPKTLRQKATDAAKKSAAQSEAATRKKAEQAKKVAKKVAKKTAKQASKAATKGAIQGASKAGGAIGVIKGTAKAVGPVIKKAAAPVAAAMEAVELAKLLTPSGREAAMESAVQKAEDPFVSRAFSSVFNPVKTVAGATGLATDALLTGVGNIKEDAASSINAKIAKLTYAKQAQENALAEGLTPDEEKELRQYARRNKEYRKTFGGIQTPEEARKAYESVFGSEESIDEMIDGTRYEDPEFVGPPASAKPEKTPPKAVEVYDDEMEGTQYEDPEFVGPPASAKPKKTPPKAVEVYDDEMEGINAPAQPSRAAILSGDKAPPESEVDYTDEAISLFKNTHGTSFDPTSSMDRGKLEVMKALLEKQGGLGDMTPNQFALQVYRNS